MRPRALPKEPEAIYSGVKSISYIGESHAEVDQLVFTEPPEKQAYNTPR